MFGRQALGLDLAACERHRARLSKPSRFVGPDTTVGPSMWVAERHGPRTAGDLPAARLANVRLFSEAFKQLSTKPEYPRHLICRLHALPPLCHEAGQQCLLDLFDALDVLEVGSLDLELRALRDGATSTLDVSVERLEKRWPALEGESEGVPRERAERFRGAKCAGDVAWRSRPSAHRRVDCRGVALEGGSTAAAARRHLSLQVKRAQAARRPSFKPRGGAWEPARWRWVEIWSGRGTRSRAWICGIVLLGPRASRPYYMGSRDGGMATRRGAT